MKLTSTKITRLIVLNSLPPLMLLFGCLLLPGYSFAYTPPIGIPDPVHYWGGTQNPIDDTRPSRPSPWNSEIPGYYYVNDDTGTNTGRPYGSPTAPRKTVPDPMPPGSLVEIHGSYNTSAGGSILLNAAGNSSAWVANTSGPVWVVFQAGDTTSKLDTTSLKVFLQGDYLYVDGVKIDGEGGSSHNMVQVGSGTAGYDADYIVFRNSEIIGNTSMIASSGVSVVGSANSVVTNVVVYNCKIHDTGNVASATDDDAHLTAVGNYAQYVWFLENDIYNGSGSGAQVGGANGGADNCSYVFYGKNVNYGSRQGGLWVKYANNVIFSQNTIRDIIDCSWSYSKGLGGQYTNNNIWYLYNTIYSGSTYKMSQGIYIASGGVGDRKIYIIGNKIYNIQNAGNYWQSLNWNNTFSPAGIFVNGGTEVTVVNNTIWGVDGYGITNTIAGAVIENNIIGGRTQSNASDLWSETIFGVTVDYNVIYSGNFVWDVRWGASTHYSSLSSFKSGVSQCLHCKDSDPLVDITNNSLRLRFGSAAMDSGKTSISSAYAYFENLYSVDIKKDITGMTRPQDPSKWDIGAYEIPSPIGKTGTFK